MELLVCVGGFSGSYSENGKIATKRANHFSQPEPYSVSIMNLILPLILVLIAINALPSMIEIMSQSMPNSSSGSLSNNTDGIFKIVSFFNYYIAPIYGLFIVYSIFSKIIKANKEEEHLNTTVYPQELKRYNKHVL